MAIEISQCLGSSNLAGAESLNSLISDESLLLDPASYDEKITRFYQQRERYKKIRHPKKILTG